MAVTTKQYWARKLSLRKGVVFPTTTELVLSTVSAAALFIMANVANGTIKF